ncbi:uncharacterized protein CANTADRAFT_90321 [Suhomyces tanzawaensis NRRL Y-17324]|uniref:tRNA-splicing endonuclease subunit Sen54 N-terminal domain-containing protein n=1 Tax=Suhomyces tanzawaensis NRRL Y-17324 TaxID=984487 RepID=A0A1E4SIA2_9ASCO|nr:uncharacterized protein CANTADRAFT_90321 [Suhomyces tanzawaensis NRRL Y-17324]ODV79225.1 hypothetical protein CANTADRAFT_90321 [Suhomyces tanzawaensis NRRL Y-17324]
MAKRVGYLVVRTGPQGDEAIIPQGESNHDIEDEVQDWRNLSKSLGSSTKTQAAIPKRGEKEFEPDGTSVQNRALQESRESMYEALSGLRGHSLKQKLVAVWMSDQGQSIVVHAKGNYFRDVGIPVNIGTKVRGGLMLSPLETVYLVERGSMVCYLGDAHYEQWLYNDTKDFDYDSLVMLDLGFLYAIVAETSHFDVDQYQVYSYLKRHGYLILQTKAKEQREHQAKTINAKQQAHKSTPETHKSIPDTRNLSSGLMFLLGIGRKLSQATSYWGSLFSTLIHHCKKALVYIQSKLISMGVFAVPTSHSLHYFTKHYFNYTEVFQSLRITPSSAVPAPSSTSLSFQLVFDVWKPTTSFSKKSPPPPDFQLCVVNTDHSNFPSLATIRSLFEVVNKEEPVKPTEKKPKKKSTLPPTKKELKYQRQLERQARLDAKVQQRNLYLKTRDNKLKFGSSGVNVIIATVNQGILNFVNLSEADFELKEIEDLDVIYPGKDHGIVYMDG